MEIQAYYLINETNKALLRLKMKRLLIFAAIVLMAIANFSIASAEWNYGIGTGLTSLNAKGDLGFNITLAGVGPAKFDVDLSPEDFNDLTRSAFGFGGYATNKTWMIQYSLVNLELEDSISTTVGAIPVSTTIGLTRTGAEVTVGRPMVKNSSFVLSAYGGVRYTKHELIIDVKAGALERHRTIYNNWIDALIGLTATIPFAETWRWNTSLDVGFGGSNGTYTGKTGVTVPFLESWSITLQAKYQAIDFENGGKGDANWYLYDVDELDAGFVIAYNW
jgi:hypothetical protein